MAYKFDIFKILGELTKGNVDFYDSLDDDVKKSVNMYLLTLWSRGIKKNREYHTILLNEMVNPYLFNLQSEPSLIWKLLCDAVEEGGNPRFEFLKKTKEETKPLSCSLIMKKLEYNRRHAEDVLELLTVEDILSLAEEYGLEPQDIKKLKDEWK